MWLLLSHFSLFLLFSFVVTGNSELILWSDRETCLDLFTNLQVFKGNEVVLYIFLLFV